MRIFFLTLIIFFTSKINAQIKGKAIKVSDGDTFVFVSEQNDTFKVRLAGIDCPEKKQDFGAQATLFSSSFLMEKQITLIREGKPDRYNRVLAYVFNSEYKVSLNELLVINGFAWHYKQYNNFVGLSNAEEKARNKRINIWSQSNPVAPWEFRNGKRNLNKQRKESKSSPRRK